MIGAVGPAATLRPANRLLCRACLRITSILALARGGKVAVGACVGCTGQVDMYRIRQIAFVLAVGLMLAASSGCSVSRAIYMILFPWTLWT